MTNVFTVRGGTSHSTTLRSLRAGTTYNYYVRCQSSAGAANTDDYGITFSIAGASTGPVMRINSGGPAYVATAANSWDVDHNYWGGDSNSSGTARTGASTPAI